MKKIEFRLYCTECGSILEMGEPEIMVGKDFTILVKPCYVCAARQSAQRTVDISSMPPDDRLQSKLDKDR